MKRQDHYAACANCIYLDAEHGCNNGITWIGELPIPEGPYCHTPILYRHPDGVGLVVYSGERNVLEVSNEITGRAVLVPIGPKGLRRLAENLLIAARKLEDGDDK